LKRSTCLDFFNRLLGISGFADWAGTDGSGLGSIDGTTGGNNQSWLNGFGLFEGDISFFRFYDTALTAGDVEALFGAVAVANIPEPSTFALFTLGALGIFWFGRRRKVK